MFGNNYIKEDGSKAVNGFEALEEFDSNGDGVVDARDDRWSELQLWQDKNSNGIVDDGELLSMEEAGVAGLNTGYKNLQVVDENGNKHAQSGSFIREDGTTGEMTDVWFLTSLTETVFRDEIPLDNETILALPNLCGYGNVVSLRQAIAADSSGRLQGMVEGIVTASPSSWTS